MAIKSFPTLRFLANQYDGHVYRDTTNDTLLVHDKLNNIWHRYAWTHGKREIQYRETLRGAELPIMVQVYPPL